jgi:NADH-quinone oxidoreductase subunit E
VSLAPNAGEILARYPKERSRSAILPLLLEFQERDGYVTRAAIGELAEILGISAAEVSGVASFYHMLKLRPHGRRIVSVCHNLACTLLGAEDLIAALEENLGVRSGETTPDGEFTLERAECLAACDKAPMIQVDYDEMLGPLTTQEAVELLRRLRSPGGRRPFSEEIPAEVPAGAHASPGAAERPDDAVTDVEARWEPEEDTFLIDTIPLTEEEESHMHRLSEPEE